MAQVLVFVVHTEFAWPRGNDKYGTHAKRGHVIVSGTPDYDFVTRNHPEKGVKGYHDFPDAETPAAEQAEIDAEEGEAPAE